jgi:FlaA1/EpsC-like NDP-sugar epimerase
VDSFKSNVLSDAISPAVASDAAHLRPARQSNLLQRVVRVRESMWVRALLLLACYAAVLLAARYLAYQLRFEFHVPEDHLDHFRHDWHWELSIKLLFLVLFRQLSGLLSYFSVPDLRRLFFATAVSSGCLFLLRHFYPDVYGVGRGYLLNDWLLSFCGLSLVSLGFRNISERFAEGLE